MGMSLITYAAVNAIGGCARRLSIIPRFWEVLLFAHLGPHSPHHPAGIPSAGEAGPPGDAQRAGVSGEGEGAKALVHVGYAHGIGVAFEWAIRIVGWVCAAG